MFDIPRIRVPTIFLSELINEFFIFKESWSKITKWINYQD